MGKVLRRKGLGGGTRLIKAEAARPECEGEEVKPPSIQAAGAR
ncbi:MULTISPECIES: hypothetical protein [Bacillus]|nr:MULTISPECIES: hypothetical protein [Bacillus]MCU5326154.1 hypothetical protein [Bacillus cereus]MCU5713843.1 hypothetical protein [Bacillus cereus]MDA1844488.1 hypothetical protein [Bacillus cereus]